MIKRILIFIIVSLVVLQFFQIDKSNPEEKPSLSFASIEKPPIEVFNLMESACFDCHSYQTEYPWYTYIQPVGWYLKNHVTHAREKLNFSEWGGYSNEDRGDLRKEAAEEVQDGDMPPQTFILLHPEAKFTDKQKQSLTSWLRKNSKNNRSTKGDMDEEDQDD